MTALAQKLEAQGETVGLLVSKEMLEYWRREGVDQSRWQIAVMGSRTDAAEVAASIYRGLRELDGTNATQIILEGFRLQGLDLRS